MQIHKLSFQQELNKKTKRDLAVISSALGISTNHQKQKTAELIASRVAEIFQTQKSKDTNQQFTLKYILDLFNANDKLQCQFMRRCLQKYIKRTQMPYILRQLTKNYQSGDRKCYCVSISQQCNTINNNLGKPIQCMTCKDTYHQNCIKLSNRMGQFECPFCFSKKMDPLNQVVSTLFQGYIRPNEKIQRIQFKLGLQELQKGEAVEARSIRLDGKNNYELSWPDAGEILLNGNKVIDLKPLVTNSSLKKRKDESKILEMDHLKKINRIMFNLGNHSYSHSKYRISGNIHFVAIFVVRLLKPQQLIYKILSNSIIPFSDSQKLLAAQFQQNRQFSVQRVDISLRCAYSATQIQIPSRGRLCKHFRCFDLKNIICAISKSRRWKCPICKQRVNQLVVDPFLKKIIETYKQKKIKQVSFQKNQSYSIVYQADDSQDEQQSPIATNRKVNNGMNKQIQTINIDDDEEMNLEEVNFGGQEMVENVQQEDLRNNLQEGQIDKSKMDLQNGNNELRENNMNRNQIRRRNEGNIIREVNMNRNEIELEQEMNSNKYKQYNSELSKGKQDEQKRVKNKGNNECKGQINNNNKAIVILDSQQQDEQYLQNLRINKQMGKLKDLTSKRFSNKINLNQDDFIYFLKLTRNILGP